MKPWTQEQIETDVNLSKAVREVCEKSIAEPSHIWDALEAKGIDVTPGVLYQAIGDLHKLRRDTAGENPSEKALAAETGLTVEDVEVVAALAQKAGGVPQLVRFLSAMDSMRP
jgi:hypothetical protein